MIEKRLFFRQLLKLNKPGVYALVNEKHKKVLIQASNDIVKHLGKNVALLSKRIHPNKELRKDRNLLIFKHLEFTSHKDIAKLKWLHHYKALGYTVYNTERLPVYRIRSRVVANVGTICVQVQLVSAGKRVYAVREFATDIEAKGFMESNTLYDMLKLVVK